MAKNKERKFLEGNVSDELTEEFKLQNFIYNNFQNTTIRANYDSLVVKKIWGIYYGVIYLIIFTKLKKLYVGQTIQNFRKRFQQHLSDPPNRYFKSAINEILARRNKKTFSIIKIDSNKFRTKDGEIIIKILKFYKNPKKLNKAEKYFIKKYKTYVRKYGTKYGYNVNPGGAGGNQLKGIFNPSYKFVDKNLLYKMITKGYFAIEIAKELGFSEGTVNDKIFEFWGEIGICTLTEARAKFGGAEIAKARYARILREALSSYKELDIELLISSIRKGYFGKEIAKILKISVNKFFNYLNWIGFANLTEARRILGGYEAFKKREKSRQKKCNVRGKYHPNYTHIDEYDLKTLIIEGYSVEKIAFELKTTIWTIYSKINDNWQLTYKQARRLFRIYSKINNNLLNELIDDGLNIQEIDKEFLKYLIKKGLEQKKIAQKYEKSISAMRNMVRRVLKVKDFDKAVDQYYWIPNLIENFRLKRSAKEIVLKLKKNYETVRLKIKQFWKKDFKRLGNYPSLMRFLHNKYACKNIYLKSKK